MQIMPQMMSKYDTSSNSVASKPSYHIHGAFKEGKNFSAELIARLTSEEKDLFCFPFIQHNIVQLTYNVLTLS